MTRVALISTSRAALSVNALGYGDPGLRAALHAAANGLVHTSNLFHTQPGAELAQWLVDHSFADQGFPVQLGGGGQRGQRSSSPDDGRARCGGPIEA